MGDTFENSFSEFFELEEEEAVHASLTLWPTAASAPFKSRTLVFDKGPVVVGRASSNNGNFNFPTISRAHATLSFATSTFWVSDHSMNGTYVNNQKVGKMPMKLNHGDTLQLGVEGGPDDKSVIALVHLHYPTMVMEKTISLESLIKEMEREENKGSGEEARLQGLRDALEDRKIMNISTRDAVAMQPSLLNFPETQDL